MDKQPVRDMDAFIDPVHDAAFNNCIKALAVNVGMSAKSLYRRLDDNDAMPLRFVDFVSIFWSVDYESRKEMIQPFLDDMGMVAVKRTEEGVGRGDVLGSVLDSQTESGRLAGLIHQVIADGEVDEDEAASLDAQFRAIEAATAKLKADLASMKRPALRSVGQ